MEDRFEGLNLCGEEEIDLDFSEELEELIKEVRWLAILKVHTTQTFSHVALFNARHTASFANIPRSRRWEQICSLSNFGAWVTVRGLWMGVHGCFMMRQSSYRNMMSFAL